MEKACVNRIVENLLHSLHDGIVVIDGDGVIVYANPAYTRVLGINTGSVIGKKMSEIAPEAIALQCLKTKEPIINKPSRVISLGIDIVVNATPVIKNGNLIGVISLFRDVSEITCLTEQLNRMNEYAKYLQTELASRDGRPKEFEELISNSKNFINVLKQSSKVAKTDSAILIRGESGVGKDILATAIHNASKRKNSPLIKINCAAIPENLLESELYGYEEGAFTGAKKGGKPGKFELANKGTLFLDEIGDMSVVLQAKLLRTLQDKKIERLGGIKTTQIDVRIIAATNQNLDEKIRERSFREDLYYRINTFQLFIPPLRERKDDIIFLAGHFLSEQNEKYGKSLSFDKKVIHTLYNYSWPGNVRELQNVVEHAVIICEGNYIGLNDLPPNLLQNTHITHKPTENPDDLNLTKIISDLEETIINKAMLKAKGNKSEAIKMLGISRANFYSKLNKYQKNMHN